MSKISRTALQSSHSFRNHCIESFLISLGASTRTKVFGTMARLLDGVLAQTSSKVSSFRRTGRHMSTCQGSFARSRNQTSSTCMSSHIFTFLHIRLGGLHARPWLDIVEILPVFLLLELSLFTVASMASTRPNGMLYQHKPSPWRYLRLYQRRVTPRKGSPRRRLRERLWKHKGIFLSRSMP